MADHLILTDKNNTEGDLNLFIGDSVDGKHYTIDIRKQIMWLRTLMASVDRYLAKDV